MISLSRNDDLRFASTFWVKRSSAFASPSVATTRSADRTATIEQIPPQPHPSSKTLFPATIVGFELMMEAINRADSQSIRAVDCRVLVLFRENFYHEGALSQVHLNNLEEIEKLSNKKETPKRNIANTGMWVLPMTLINYL